jgi:hypothetical protein
VENVGWADHGELPGHGIGAALRTTQSLCTNVAIMPNMSLMTAAEVGDPLTVLPVVRRADWAEHTL